MSPIAVALRPDLALDAALRRDLASFVRKVFGTVSPGVPFLPNWHIEAMCHELARVVSGETKRLIITIPPRHLKSICASVALPAWVLGHDPTRRIICVSYAQDLAIKHGNDCRVVMTSDWYQRLFRGTKIDDAKNTETEVMTTKRGSRLSTSVGGTLTGRGGNMIIIDDPLKPADGMSDTARERHIEWYSTTLISRLDNKEQDAIIVVMQRLHEGDLVGHLLHERGWKHLSLPAIAETEQQIEIGPRQFHMRQIGDLLHPARESRDVLENIKRGMGSAIFSAQYQQEPVPPGGNMIDWNWFGFYEHNDYRKFEEIIISWDTAMKATEISDFSVGTAWGVFGGYYYLLDLIRVRLDYPALRRKIVELYFQYLHSQYPRPTLLIEDAGSGTSLIQDLKEQNIRAIAIKPESDKVVRMSAQSAKIESRQVFLLRHANWLEDLRTEMLAFPYGAHDDQVDSISQALYWMSRPRWGGAVGA
jgi:predicted phage terminase large subunit-like protein